MNDRLRELASFRDELEILVSEAPALRGAGATGVCAIVEEAVPAPRTAAARAPLRARRSAR